MKTKIDELQEFKDMFFETFKLKLSQSHSEYTLKDYAAYVTTKYDLFKKLFMVPNNKELDGITFIK
jgi:hypothetical protein